MKIIVFYRPKSEHERSLNAYLYDLQKTHDIRDKDIEMLSIDTRDGADRAVIYGVLDYPAIVIIDNNGAFVQSWHGQLPLYNELMSYIVGH